MFLYKPLSNRAFNLVLGGLVLYGLLANVLTTIFLGPLFRSMNPLGLMLGFLVLSIIGIACGRSSSLWVRFLAYHLIVIPFGPVLAVVLPEYAAAEVFLAVVLTTVITVGMIGLSVLFPTFFLRSGRVLCISLLLAIIAEVIGLLLGFHSSVFSWIGVIIFSVFLGFDWYRAQSCTKSLYDAIECATELYLDVTNLFVDLLDLIDLSDLF